MIVAEVLLFAGNQLVGHWFTPIVWTGYILFVDALVHSLSGRSLLKTDRVEFLLIAVISIAAWWLCEFYNAPRFWKSDLELWWHYHNLEPNLMLRRVGYDWAFATIFPLLFLTAEFLESRIRSVRADGGWEPIESMVPGDDPNSRQELRKTYRFKSFKRAIEFMSKAVDPINALRGWPAITNDLARGDHRRLWSLLTSGFICGFLWEFFNYWALSKWTYTVPYLGNIKIFEMPVLGFLGFPPFAIECWAIYIFVRSLLEPTRRNATAGEIILRAP